MQMHEQRDTTSSERIYTAKDSRKTRKKLFSTSETKLKSEHVDFCTGFFFGGGLRDCLLGCYLQGTNPTESKKIQVQLGLPGCLGSSKLMMCQMV